MTQVELTAPRAKKEETKERILQAAFALFRKRGVDATTVEEICEKADVAKGTFFNYFPRKEAVFGYLSETWVADAEEKLTEILAKGTPAWTKGPGPVHRVRELLRGRPRAIEAYGARMDSAPARSRRRHLSPLGRAGHELRAPATG